MGVVQRRPEDLTVSARDTVPLIEAAIVGKSSFGAAEMPLAQNSGGLALRRQELRKGNLPKR